MPRTGRAPAELQQAADILDTSEYEVLRIAYEMWFGDPPARELLERVYARHFRDAITPYWGRHYAQRVIREFEQRNGIRRWGRGKRRPADAPGHTLEA